MDAGPSVPPANDAKMEVDPNPIASTSVLPNGDSHIPSKPGSEPASERDRDSNAGNVSNGIPDDPPQRAVSEPYSHPNYIVGYVYSNEMLNHYPVEDHPERPARISGIYNAMKGAGLLERMRRIPVRKLHKLEAMLVHSEDQYNQVIDFQCEVFLVSITVSGFS
jgi:hypothetical protein